MKQDQLLSKPSTSIVLFRFFNLGYPLGEKRRTEGVKPTTDQEGMVMKDLRTSKYNLTASHIVI